jgi:two-component system invasion response regulator UvrY
MFEKLAVKNDVELAYMAMKHRVIERPSDALQDE